MSDVIDSTPAQGGEATDASTDAPVVNVDGSTDAAPAEKSEGKAALESATPATKHRVKVYGEERELTTEELIANAQKGFAADRRFQEAAAKEKAFEDAKARLAKDPWNAAKDLVGKDLRQQLIQELVAEMEAEELKAKDPGAYEREQLKKELAAEREKAAQYEQEQLTRAQQAEFQRVQQETFSQYDQALTKSGLPRSEELILEAIDIELAALRQGRQLSAEEIAAGLKAQHSSRHTSAVESEMKRIASLSGEDLLKAFPEDMIASMQKALLGRAQAKLKRPALSQPVAQPKASKSEQEQPRYRSDSSVLRDLMRD